MRFNKYIWDLYKDSTNYKDCIVKWDLSNGFPNNDFADDAPKSVIDNLLKNGLSQYLIGSKVNWSRFIFDFISKKTDFSIDNIREVYKSWIDTGVQINDFVGIEPKDYQFWTSEISFISTVLYSKYPEYFFPYILDCEFDKFTNICNEFNIPIPGVPHKKDWDKRALYYIDLCEALNEFRKINNFSPQDLCAFLYDFAPSILTELEDTELPYPSKVWFVGGNKNDFDFLDNATLDSKNHWQGNIDAKKGDIVVMYCLSPRSYIHSIWRVIGNGFADPFFYYYSVVALSYPIKIDIQVNQKDLENNSVWSQNPLVRKNLQGINGYPIKYSEYLELLSMFKSKGQNITNLPTIKPTSKFDSEDLNSERDVEIKLIEPFLLLLKYKTTDWIRQMPVKMGRGERNYPDYCFRAITQRGEEFAKMILESKWEIKTNKDLQEAYFQAKSYAIRLQSECFVIAAMEGIWIFYPKKFTYRFDDYLHYNWVDIENPDILHKLKNMIGKK